MLGQFDDSRFHLRSKGAKGYFRGALGGQGGGLTCINGYYGYFGGTENGTSGAWIKIVRPLSIQIPPLKPHLDTLGTILDPGKVIFGHFIYFGHFPIEIPIEAEKIYQHGKELS